ncbi:MAG: TonB-dependent receptor [Bacteroidia bacterium]|nr:TonB-dependent receptor [Bacteroidia bacterium]
MKRKLIQTLLLLTLVGSSTFLIAQHRVTGTVYDEEGTALEGATVLVIGTTTGIFTDENGSYTLNLPTPNDSLLVSFFGFKDMSVKVAGRSVVNVTLPPDEYTLNEYVVVGYGVQRKSDVTGSVTSVNAEELARVPNASVAQILQGKAAGVQVTPSSGAPGAGAVIRIRGVGTLGDASPLFVVDGMLLDDISFLNPNDIGSFEVLKDASATAIYGSRGANGVIIITTKAGVQGKSTVTVNAYEGFQEVVRKIDLTNAREYAELSNELSANEGRPPVFADPSIYGEGTDWQDVIFQQAPMRNYQVAASGASDKMSYRVSGDYFSQQGIIRNGSYDRMTLRINNTYQINKAVNVGHNVALIYSRNIGTPGILSNAYRGDPTIAPFDTLGNFSNTTLRAPVGNPEASIFYNNNQSFNYRAVGNVFADVTFLKDFRFRTNLGIDVDAGFFKDFTPVFFVSPIQQNQQSRLNAGIDRSQNILWENTLTYQKEWTNQRLTVLGGVTAQTFDFENLGGSRINFPAETEEFFFLNAGEIEGQTNYNSAFSWSMASYLARANYSLMDRYLFTASFRADGSSRFGANQRFGYFPSFAFGWNIAEEAFMKGMKDINRLKLRASWGQIGNDKIGAYAGRPVVTSNLNAVFGPTESLNTGASIITLANPDIRWEETSQTDIGLEIGLLNDRFTAEVDYYNRVTNDILVNVPIPAYVGAANNPVINAAKVQNRGFDMSLAWRDEVGDFDYSFKAMASTVHNEVLELGEGNEEIFGGGLGVGGLLGTRTVPGLPIGAFYGYKVEGVFQTQEEIDNSPNRGIEKPGDLKFVDVNEDGVITTADRTYLGSPVPTLIYSGDLSLGYKGLSLVVSLYGQRGNYVINSKKMARFGTPNFEASYLDRWNGEGTSNTEPRITNGGHNYEPSERFLENAAFTRIRTVLLSYDLPRSWLSAINMSQVQLYVSGTNLFTWQQYSGYTPEITSGSVIAVGIDSGVYPISKIWTGGINLSF